MARPTIGIWLVGARGGVATTTMVGLAALQRKKISTMGLVSELPDFTHLPLPSWDSFVVGGHDIRTTPLIETAEAFTQNDQAIRSEIVQAVRRDLTRMDKNIRPGTLINVGDTIEQLADGRLKRKNEKPRAAIERIQSDLKEFVRKNKLQHLVVVNVASTEPQVDERNLPRKWADLDKLLDQPRKCPLGASSIYAIAALDLGYAYVNFTPSLGSKPKAICELATQRNTCHMGHDGKTGETLLKSVLAPMFA
ncbi:MAG: inositol-3-phosphate synthase, partial [Planctomycetota bacterium]